MNNRMPRVRAWSRFTGSLLALVILATGPLAIATTAQETAFDPAAFDVGLEPVAEGFAAPLYVTHAGDERLFVVEQAGTIQTVEGGEIAATPFLDLTGRVGSDASERGLLGLAFAPNYAETGLFYVNYTDLDGNTVVSRFAAPDGATGDPESEEVILTQEQPFPNHNGGMLAFGPDNYLYIGLGDGGGQGDPNGNGQSLDTWLGKILRIEVDPLESGGEPYAVPDDNPFVSDSEARPEIWAHGLRNPWRFSFDREKGDLWIGDVGQNEYEEVSVLAVDEGGANLGWNIVEGPECYAEAGCDPGEFVEPVFSYTHSSGAGCSVTGGYVSRGEEFAALNGVYVLADYCTGLIWGGGPDASGELVFSEPVESGFQISSFGEGVNGAIYLTDITGGTVYELVPPL
jgi:glucose/arabinose dehydrogenase